MINVEEMLKGIFNLENTIKEKQDEYNKEHSFKYAFLGRRTKRDEINLLNIALDEYKRHLPVLESYFIIEWNKMIEESLDEFKKRLGEYADKLIVKVQKTDTVIPSPKCPMSFKISQIDIEPLQMILEVPKFYVKEDQNDKRI